LETDEPEYAVPIAHLSVAVAPRSELKVIDDGAMFGKMPKPGRRNGLISNAKKGEHQSSGAEGFILLICVGAEQSHRTIEDSVHESRSSEHDQDIFHRRSVDVLREFLTPSINMTPKKLARRTELPKTTVHRTMSELGRVGMLE